MDSFARRSIRARAQITTRDNPLPVALAAVGRGFAKRLFTVPAHVRALKQGGELLVKAQAGDIQASVDLDRLRFWAATSRAKQVFADIYAKLEPRFRIPHDGSLHHDPPGTPVDFKKIETRLSARAANEKKQAKEGSTTRGQGSGARATTRRAAAPRAARVSAAPRARRAARAPKAKLVSRYSPDTGRRVRVPEDSLEASEWPSRKPTRSAASRRAETQALRAAQTAGGAAIPAFFVAVKAAGAAAGLGIAATAAAITGAFAVGFAIGVGINKLAAHFSREERNVRKVLAFRAARARFALEAGRPMTKAEVQQMGAGFKASLS